MTASKRKVTWGEILDAIAFITLSAIVLGIILSKYMD